MPDDVYKTAESFARQAGRPVADVLVDAVTSSLRPLGRSPSRDRPVQDWSDADVIVAADAMMSAEQNRRLSELLARQREGELTADEPAELSALMQVYEEGTLTKARALREAVRRGLRPPLTP